jgi:hypothetical protein
MMTPMPQLAPIQNLVIPAKVNPMTTIQKTTSNELRMA